MANMPYDSTVQRTMQKELTLPISRISTFISVSSVHHSVLPPDGGYQYPPFFEEVVFRNRTHIQNGHIVILITLSRVSESMTVGVVTSFSYNDREFDVPTSKPQRKQFTSDLVRELEALDGVAAVFHAGSTQTMDSIRLEISIETEERDGTTRLVPSTNSISPRIRNVFKKFTPASSYDVLYTPTPINADECIYEDALYIAEVWLY